MKKLLIDLLVVLSVVILSFIVILVVLADLGVFYFVCIIQHGPHEFYCSRVLSTNDATEGNFLVFPEKFTL